MVTIECPWCEGDLPVGETDTVRCEPCRVELVFSPEPHPAAAALAA